MLRSLLLTLAGCVLFSSPSSLSAQQPAPEKEEKKFTPPKRVAHLGGFQDWVTSVTFSADGKWLAGGSYDLVKLWDAEKRTLVETIKTRTGYAKSLAFSPDSSLLAVGGYQRITIYDVATQKRKITLRGHRGYVTGVEFSADGEKLVSSSEDQSLQVWNVAEKKSLLTIKDEEFPIMDVALSPDGTLLAAAIGDINRVTQPGYAKLWDATTGQLKTEFPRHLKAATSVVFSSDGKFLLSTSEDEKIHVYNVTTGKAVGFYSGHSRPTNSAILTADNRTVISGSGGRAKGKNEVKIWDRDDGREWTGLEAHKERINAVALSPEGNLFATASHDKTVALWDVKKTLEEIHKELGLPDGGVKNEEKTEEPRQPVEAPRPKPVVTPVVPKVPAAKKPELNARQLPLRVPTETVAVLQEETTPPTIPQLKVGIIGLDTSHSIAFAKILNEENAKPDVAGCRVVCAYPHGSADIESSASRIPRYTKQIEEMGIEVVDSIPALLKRVDVVLLETNDGRPHFEQALQVFQAGKPVFIDKPVAASLTDCIAIFAAAKHYNVPVFTSSSLRFSEGAQKLRAGSLGEIIGCDAYSPASLEKTHPDLYWYGIHGVETLFTVMGTGCQSVVRVQTDGSELVVGTWKNGRIGTFRGIREGKGSYGGTAFGTKGIAQIGPYGGYRPLLVEVVKFFRNGKSPIPLEEMVEIYAFMEAADESKRQGGKPVTMESVMTKAQQEAQRKLAQHLQKPSR